MINVTKGWFVWSQCYTKLYEGKELLFEGKNVIQLYQRYIVSDEFAILFDKIIDFLDKNRAVDLISLDFYKVFDIVKRLIKLEKQGLMELCRKCLES